MGFLFVQDIRILFSIFSLFLQSTRSLSLPMSRHYIQCWTVWTEVTDNFFIFLISPKTDFLSMSDLFFRFSVSFLGWNYFFALPCLTFTRRMHSRACMHSCARVHSRTHALAVHTLACAHALARTYVHTRKGLPPCHRRGLVTTR